METPLISFICISIIIVVVLTLVLSSFQAASTLADSLKDWEKQTAQIRQTEISVSQWHSIVGIAYQGNGGVGYLKTVGIADTVIDTLIFDATAGREPDIIQISGDIYAIAYRGVGDDGFLKTVEIVDSGKITDTVIDTLEFDATAGREPDIIQVSGDIYAIAYRGDGDDGFLKTVEIDATGQITDTVIDTVEFDTVKGLEPDIVYVSGNIFAIAYRGDGDDGFLVTVKIVGSGKITGTVRDTLEFDAAAGLEPDMVHVSGEIYAIAYRGEDDDGFLKTVEINATGQITNTVIDTLEFDAQKGREPSMVGTSGDMYAVAYRGDGDDGFLKTVEIDATGQITDTVIDTLEFDVQKGREPSMVGTSGGMYAIAYRGDGDDGFLGTVEIASTGQITDTVVDRLEFDESYCAQPDIIQISAATSGLLLTVVNQGETTLAEFPKWDVVVRYEDGTAGYIDYTTSSPPGSNEWTVEGIYLLDDNPEVFDPNMLNPREYMILTINIDPGIGAGETVMITISTPNGVTSQDMVSR